jgi:TetR/AcrR family tetracycline transcriptional repressor
MASRTSLREPLSRSEIVRCALVLAERDGLEKLSLHRIAAAVGVKTMSLYNHVADKSDVLDAMSDQILAEMVIPDVDAMSWEDAIFELSLAFRTAAMRYRHSAPLVLVRRLNAPSVMPVVDTALRSLRRAGFDPAGAVHALRTLIAFLVGSLLREVGSTPTTSATAATVIATPETDLLQAGLPSVAESAAELAVCDHDAEFRFGLGLFVESLRARILTRHDTQRSQS